MIRTASTEIHTRISGPKNGMPAICGNAETIAALPAATCTATVTV